MKREESDALDEGSLEEQVAGVRITHPQRMVFRPEAISKLALARYYEQVAAVFLPEIDRRPLSLLRCPDGAGGQCFFQKHVHDRLAGVQKVVRARGKASAVVDAPEANIVAQDIAGAIALVQRGVVEFHTWGSGMPRLDRPNRLVFDLDPDDGVSWTDVVDATRHTRLLLDGLGLPSWLKTTGGKGLHLVIPIKPTHEWGTVKDFAHRIALRLAADDPERFVATASKEQRQGKVFVDYLRNAEEATAVAAWGVRARDGAPVSMPLLWDELDATVDVRGDHFNLLNAHERLDGPAQAAWARMTGEARTLTKVQLAAV